MAKAPMNVYYLRDRWLRGPISVEELSSLIDASIIDEKTAVWTPTLQGWALPSSILQASGDTTELPAPARAEADGDTETGEAATEEAGPPEWKKLPLPKNLLALRMIRDQELITKAQTERVVDTLFKSHKPEVDLLASLQSRGWITSSQRATIEAVIGREASPKLIAGYEILRKLGAGGMGTTYLARQINMDRLIALKVLQQKFSQDEDYIRRFDREAKMAARLNHENVATAYEVGDVAGQHFISMEYVEGKTVAQIVDEKGAIPEKDAVDIVMQVCRALQHAHEHDMVHRDVKSDNIIVRPKGQVKIIDMGLAKSTASDARHVTETGLVVCTPDYASPEQGMGSKDVDIRSDIYSLGCVFYEMMTGEQPFPGASPMETVNLHINEPLPPVRSLAPGATDVVCRVIERMTQKRPDDRHQTPNEVIEELTSGTAWSAPAASRAAVRPVQEQLAAWKRADRVEVSLLPEWREYVHLIALKVEDRLERAKVDPEFHGYAQTVFAELVANAFDHGCRDVTEGAITIRMELNDAFFSLEVEDPGPGFPAKETLAGIKKESFKRERRRGIMQVSSIADVITYSPKGNHVKVVLYRKSEGSGIFTHEREGIHYVEIKGKGDLALVEQFKRWVDNYDYTTPGRVCMMIRTEWVSSLFVGTMRAFSSNLSEAGSALSVWVEHQSCYRIMQNLGVTVVVHTYTSLGEAELALRYADVKAPEPATPEPAGLPTQAERHETVETPSPTVRLKPRRRPTTGKARRGCFGWLKGMFGG